jgi:hypothetical protein
MRYWPVMIIDGMWDAGNVELFRLVPSLNDL